ncbi:uncharacterized protein TM35_000431500 [Trypanosoma theileri]|uniref:Uncharacterized protein n=1 Tax=Trypanosoma theileri TaxID=67003 RepID=A0A1X0NIL3_9TRYP|nr:uncharacterized protein TM35_000431500 [Trypanosoma theileri]ORC84582.1 hypothetical protein TM35_000431500 [Trypanosoma theileri]
MLASLNRNEKHIPIKMETFIRSLHGDALVSLLEYLAIYQTHCLFQYTERNKSEKQKASYLCELLFVALIDRIVELSSKHVAFIVSLCNAAGIISPAFYLILYYSRQSLRRTQAIQTLRSICTISTGDISSPMIYHSFPNMMSAVSIQVAALSFLLIRCMELESTLEGYDTGQILCRALIRYFGSVQPDVRTACLWRARKMIRKQQYSSEPVNSSNNSNNNKLMESNSSFPSELELILAESSSPQKTFAAMEEASRSLTLINVDTAYLRSLILRNSVTNHNKKQWNVNSTPEVVSVDHIVRLHQQLPLVEKLHGELKLSTIEVLSQRVMELSHLQDVVSLAESTIRYCPLLSPVLLHRILQLSCIEESNETAEAFQSTLTALYRLLPHVDILDVLESAIVYGTLTGISTRKSVNDEKMTSISLSFVKCLAIHVPKQLVPTLFHRLFRQRELAAFQLPTFLLRVLLEVLESIDLDSLSTEDVKCIQLFLQQERRKLVPWCTQKEEEMMNNSHLLMDAIEKAATLRTHNIFNESNTTTTTTIGTTSNNNSNSTSAITMNADQLSLSIEPKSSDNTMSVVKNALTSIFGVRAAIFVTAETALQHRKSLSWLYAMYRISVSLLCELEAFKALALFQGKQLHINEKQCALVQLSESIEDDNLLEKGDDLQTSNYVLHEGELRSYIEQWLSDDTKESSLLKQLISLASGDDITSSFISYAALSRHDIGAMNMIRLHSWSSAVVFDRERICNNNCVYSQPLQRCEEGEEISTDVSVSTVGNDGNDVDNKHNIPLYKDIIAISKSALHFVELQWSGKDYHPPTAVNTVCLWAYADLVVLEKDPTMRLNYYEALLRLCKSEKDVMFLQQAPSSIHRDVFAFAGGRGMWQQGIELIRLAESVSKEFQLPPEVYGQVMRACLMHRVPIPSFLRERFENITNR